MIYEVQFGFCLDELVGYVVGQGWLVCDEFFDFWIVEQFRCVLLSEKGGICVYILGYENDFVIFEFFMIEDIFK